MREEAPFYLVNLGVGWNFCFISKTMLKVGWSSRSSCFIGVALLFTTFVWCGLLSAYIILSSMMMLSMK